jgi:hypothetical protein
MEETALSDHAQIMLKIMRSAIRRGLFPLSFTTEVLETIIEVLALSKEEHQAVQELIRTDIREQAATQRTFYGGRDGTSQREFVKIAEDWEKILFAKVCRKR